MAVDVDLRTRLLADVAITAITTTVVQNTIPQEATMPLVWYQRRGSEEELDLAGNGGIITTRFDIEIVDEDIDVALTLAELIKVNLNGYRGALGTIYAQAVFVEDHDDDYISKTVDSDEGIHVASLDVRIMHVGA